MTLLQNFVAKLTSFVFCLNFFCLGEAMKFRRSRHFKNLFYERTALVLNLRSLPMGGSNPATKNSSFNLIVNLNASKNF